MTMRPVQQRPRWGSPVLWLGVCAVLLVIGVVVFPKLLGGVFIFLPFIWLRPRRAKTMPEQRACPACGRSADPSHAYCPACGTSLG